MIEKNKECYITRDLFAIDIFFSGFLKFYLILCLIGKALNKKKIAIIISQKANNKVFVEKVVKLKDLIQVIILLF